MQIYRYLCMYLIVIPCRIYYGLDYNIEKGLNTSCSHIIYSVYLNTYWVVLWISSEQFYEFQLTRLIILMMRGVSKSVDIFMFLKVASLNVT